MRLNEPGLRLKGWAKFLACSKLALGSRLDQSNFKKARGWLKLEVSSFYKGKARARGRLEGIFHILGLVRAQPSNLELGSGKKMGLFHLKEVVLIRKMLHAA